MKKYFLEMDYLTSMRTGVQQIITSYGGDLEVCLINPEKSTITFGFDKSEQMTRVANQLTSFGIKTKVVWGYYGNKK